jgi:hypothetical protein
MTAQFAEVKDGSFQRQPNHFTDRVTADGSSGFPVEAGRYVLYVCLACPWAHRSVIVRSCWVSRTPSRCASSTRSATRRAGASPSTRATSTR